MHTTREPFIRIIGFAIGRTVAHACIGKIKSSPVTAANNGVGAHAEATCPIFRCMDGKTVVCHLGAQSMAEILCHKRRARVDEHVVR